MAGSSLLASRRGMTVARSPKPRFVVSLMLRSLCCRTELLLGHAQTDSDALLPLTLAARISPDKNSRIQHCVSSQHQRRAGLIARDQDAAHLDFSITQSAARSLGHQPTS